MYSPIYLYVNYGQGLLLLKGTYKVIVKNITFEA